jgi:hypothetical protein
MVLLYPNVVLPKKKNCKEFSNPYKTFSNMCDIVLLAIKKAGLNPAFVGLTT